LPSDSFGNQPVGINSAVIKPQAMNAPILGITIFERKRPNRCTFNFADSENIQPPQKNKIKETAAHHKPFTHPDKQQLTDD